MMVSPLTVAFATSLPSGARRLGGFAERLADHGNNSGAIPVEMHARITEFAGLQRLVNL